MELIIQIFGKFRLEGEQPHEEEKAEEPRRGKTRSTSITIDGEDLNEVIKRALDIARMFRDKKHGDDSDEKPFTREIPAENIKSLAVRCRSADVKALLSVSGLMLEVSGSSESALHMNAREEGYLEIMTKPGDEEIDEIELRVPATIEQLSISTASGDVELRYPEDFDAMIFCSTVSGDIDHDGVAVGTRTIQIGEGLTPIRISTVSGDITIERL